MCADWPDASMSGDSDSVDKVPDTRGQRVTGANACAASDESAIEGRVCERAMQISPSAVGETLKSATLCYVNDGKEGGSC